MVLEKVTDASSALFLICAPETDGVWALFAGFGSLEAGAPTGKGIYAYRGMSGTRHFVQADANA
jgi:hypothetical protein